MPMAVRMARERSVRGLRASPARHTACSKPCIAKTTPKGRAMNTPCHPCGMKPPPVEKLPGWKLSVAITPMARNGTAVFQITTTVLLSERNSAPIRFIAVNSSIRITATTRPRVLSSWELFSMAKWSCTHPTLLT